MLSIAEAEHEQKEKSLLCVVYALLDLSLVVLLFLPFFADRADGVIYGASLLTLGGVPTYLKVLYHVLVTGIIVWGILTLALQNSEIAFFGKNKHKISLLLGALLLLLFIISLQPYAAVFSFAVLAIKALMLIKR